MLNLNKIESAAHKMAETAKDGQFKLDGEIYSFKFDRTEWVYRIYQDGILLVSFNTKSLAKAKKWFHEWKG